MPNLKVQILLYATHITTFAAFILVDIKSFGCVNKIQILLFSSEVEYCYNVICTGKASKMCYNVVCSPAKRHATGDCSLWQSEWQHSATLSINALEYTKTYTQWPTIGRKEIKLFQ